MLKKILLFLPFFLFVFWLSLPIFAFAAPPDLGVTYGDDTGLSDKDVREMIATIINVTLGLLGTIALVLVVYAGFLWMTAAGDSEQVTKAKDIMKAGVIGLAIILASYSIVTFVTAQLITAST